jgi:hypothetical protein
MQPRLLGVLHYGTAPFETVAGEIVDATELRLFYWGFEI